MASRVHNGFVSLERSGTDEAVCVSCERPLEAERCGHCGAASRAGRYRIRRVIAQGPSGRMYLAADETGAEVALKELVFALVPSIDAVEAFHREAALLRQLEHPRIPRYVESFTAGEGVHTRLYLAQQYVSGGSLLEDLNRGGTFEEPALALVAREALQILSHLHACKPPVLHRDLKPANLLRGPGGEVMLVDFGSARVHPRGATHGSTLVGTYGYMPPEQLGGTVDATSDLYALGASLVHLATGTPPADLLTRDLSLDLSGLGHLSPRLRAVIAQLVARDRAERFSSAREALAALDGGPLPRRPFQRSRAGRWGRRPGRSCSRAERSSRSRPGPSSPAPVETVRALPVPGWERTVISRQKLSWQAHPRWVSALAFSGTRLATAGVDGGLNVWDPDSGNLLSQLHGPLESVDAIALDRTGSWIATVTAGKSGFRVFEPFGKLTRVMTLEPIRTIAISPDAALRLRGRGRFDGASLPDAVALRGLAAARARPIGRGDRARGERTVPRRRHRRSGREQPGRRLRPRGGGPEGPRARAPPGAGERARDLLRQPVPRLERRAGHARLHGRGR